MAQTLYIFLYLMITNLTQRINGFSIEMIPIDSPDLGILPQHLTMREKHQYLANISLSRAYRFQRYKSILNPDSFETPFLEVKSTYFVTSIEIGKEAHFTYLLLDTGEELTWVQCIGCKPCIELKNKNFDYKKSTYYARMGKTDKLCPGEPYEGSCGFQSAYSGDTKAEGFFGRDDFNFKNSKTGQMEVYKSLAFGCGLENRNFFFGENNGPDNLIAGIYGLAPSKVSFINQLDDHIKGRFSYCIPRSNTRRLTHSILHFGDDAQISGDATRQVRTISMDSEFGYHLYLNKISIDGTRLDIDPSVFMKDPTNLDTGFIIDTGAPYTVLVKSAHDTFVEAIAKYYREKYGWNPLPPIDDWHLCYKGDYRKIAPDIPPIIFHFLRVEETEEVDMYLDSGTMFIQFSKSVFCVMVRPTEEPGVSILGAFHQSNFRFLYDIHNNLLHFVPEKCQQI